MAYRDEAIKLFEDRQIRTAWDEDREEWYFSIVDVVGVLTEQDTPRGSSNYWTKLKQRLKEEGASQLLTNCQQLKMTASDGKKRLTDVANTEQLLRIIQSVPSKKAEPFKLWLAQVGRERESRSRRVPTPQILDCSCRASSMRLPIFPMPSKRKKGMTSKDRILERPSINLQGSPCAQGSTVIYCQHKACSHRSFSRFLKRVPEPIAEAVQILGADSSLVQKFGHMRHE